MSSFCHQEVERATEVSGDDRLLPQPPTQPANSFTESELLELGW